MFIYLSAHLLNSLHALLPRPENLQCFFRLIVFEEFPYFFRTFLAGNLEWNAGKRNKILDVNRLSRPQSPGSKYHVAQLTKFSHKRLILSWKKPAHQLSPENKSEWGPCWVAKEKRGSQNGHSLVSKDGCSRSRVNGVKKIRKDSFQIWLQ